MGILEKIKTLLFDPGATPESEYFHKALGTLTWCEEIEGWKGEYNQTKFSLGYERDSDVPPPEVVEHALEILNSSFNLAERLENLKIESLSEYEAFYHQEISKLGIDDIHFYRQKGGRVAIANLLGGSDSRVWRFHVIGTKLCNLCFDS